MNFTYHTRYRKQSQNIDLFFNLYGKLSRILLSMAKTVDLKNKPVKSTFCKKYNIPTRLYNSLRVEVEGLILGVKEKLIYDKEQKEEKLKSIEQKLYSVFERHAFILGRISEDLNNIKLRNQLKKQQQIIYFLKQKINKLQKSIKYITYQLTLKVPKIVIGSKKLLMKQHSKPEKYKTEQEYKEKEYNTWLMQHNYWLDEWKLERNSNLYFVGTAAENNGNQICSPSIQKNGLIQLRILMPDCLGGGYEYINDLDFHDSHNSIIKEIQTHIDNKKLDIKGKNKGKPLTFRIGKDEESIIVYVSFVLDKKPITYTGSYIGIDLNDGFITGAIVKKDGNIIDIKNGLFKIMMDLEGKSTEQSDNIIGNVVSQLRDTCIKYGSGLCIENLDFSKKKNKLSSNKKYNKMISSFPYAKFKKALESMCYRYGIELKQVNPAYTSFIGRNKYMKQLGISVHSAAAIIIARRGQNKTEHLKNNEFVSNDGTTVTCVGLPARKDNKKQNLKPAFDEYHDLVRKISLRKKQPSNRSNGKDLSNTSGNTDTILMGAGP